MSLTNSFGETVRRRRQPLQTIDLESLVPPGMKKIPMEDLEAGVDPDTIGPPAGKDNRLERGLPGRDLGPGGILQLHRDVEQQGHHHHPHHRGHRGRGPLVDQELRLAGFVALRGQRGRRRVAVVLEAYKAWHVGCLNSRSIGIEHEGYASSSSHPAVPV